MNNKTLELAKIIWDYHHLNHHLEKADCIMVLGSHDTRAAERGAELFLQGFAPILLFSGGLGNFTKELWDESEADKFAKIAMKMGVPETNILIENKSTNTGENIILSHQILAEKKLLPKNIILVQKPYMERRTYATFMKQWPSTIAKIQVTSPQVSFTDYPTQKIALDKIINIMIGDLQRIMVYPAQGFQIPQEVPQGVEEAFRQLIEMGYDKHLAH
ncbi:hypothetical protein COB57_01800 [Candidatus Peregrinibacteria bacterium]|nr:MAG: hypothetical protein COB57_01800 [Candidatus Peregrinibacteria bacterium]